MLLTPLIGPTSVLLLLQDDAILYDVPDAFVVLALHATAVVPHHLHGDAAACSWLRLNEHERLSTYKLCTICRMSSGLNSRLS